MTAARRTWVAAHIRRLPHSEAYAEVHAELEAAWERQRRFEAAVAFIVTEVERGLAEEAGAE